MRPTRWKLMRGTMGMIRCRCSDLDMFEQSDFGDIGDMDIFDVRHANLELPCIVGYSQCDRQRGSCFKLPREPC